MVRPPGGHPSNLSPDEKKKLYQHLKYAKQDSIGVAPIRNPTTGELETEPQKKAQLLVLNSQLFSVVSPVSLIKSYKRLLGQSTPVMLEFTISEKELPSFSVPSSQTKQLARINSAPTCYLIYRRQSRQFSLESSHSYDNACCPEDLKTANVVPAFKKGSKKSRKVQAHIPHVHMLQNIFFKMMEHIVESQINRHNKAHKTLVDYQRGFRNKLSCDTHLTKFVEELHVGTTTLGKTVDVIAMDFAKALNKVSHLLLLHRLHGFGIQGKNNAWIKCWLIGQSQCVVLGGVLSEPCPVSSGVLQGSVLSQPSS